MNRTVAAIVLALTLVSCGNNSPPPPAPPTPVRVQTVSPYTPAADTRYSASITPYTQVVASFRTGGYIASIRRVQGVEGIERDLQAGDEVRQGDVLASLRELDYKVRLDQVRGQFAEARSGEVTARAQLAEAEAGLARAAKDFERSEALYRSKSLTRPDYDATRAQRDAAQARVDAARSQVESIGARIRTVQAALDEAEIAKADSVLRSPLNGTILERRIEQGALAAAGQACFVIADTRYVKALFGVPDLEVVNLKLGAPLSLTVEALGGRTFRGRITKISPAADPRTRVFDVEVIVANPGALLRPGMIASLTVGLTSRAEPSLVVPLSAIVRSSGDEYAVMVVERQSGSAVVRLRPVTLGETYGNRIAVTRGLSDGQQVVATGATLLRDGQPVRIVP